MKKPLTCFTVVALIYMPLSLSANADSGASGGSGHVEVVNPAVEDQVGLTPNNSNAVTAKEVIVSGKQLSLYNFVNEKEEVIPNPLELTSDQGRDFVPQLDFVLAAYDEIIHNGEHSTLEAIIMTFPVFIQGVKSRTQ